MRIVALLPCLLLTACLANGNQPAPEASVVAATPAPDTSATAAKPRASSARGGGAAAGGGATTSAASAAPTGRVESNRDALTQARVGCWMQVEHEKGLKEIDRRIAFVDKCVANVMKGKP